MITGRFYTPANIVSLSRIPLTLAAGFFLWHGNTFLTLAFVVLAIATDAVDGILARRTGTVSNWGKILDPLADKISFGIFSLVLLLKGLVPLWVVAVVVLRDFLIVAGGALLYKNKKPPSASFSGKLSTVFLSLFMLRQSVIPGVQVPSENWFHGTDLLGVFAVFLVVLSFFLYVFRVFHSGKGLHETQKT